MLGDVSWLKHTAWTGEGSLHSEFLPSRELPTGIIVTCSPQGQKKVPAMPPSPSLPTVPLMHHPLPGILVAQVSRMEALGSLQVHVHLWYLILTDWKQKGVLSCHLQSVLAKRPSLPMPLTLNTGAVAGSCSLWVLAPREMGSVPSESCQQTLLLAPGYEMQLCGITEQRVGGNPPLKCGVLTPKAGVCEQPTNKLTFTLAQRPQAAPRLLSRAMPQTSWKNDCNANLLQLQSYSSKSNINLSKVPFTLKV